MSVIFNPSNATDNPTVKWLSSNPAVATVSDGELTGIAVGTATVTAKAGDVKAECAVTILPPKGAVDLGIELTRADGTTYKLYWAECKLGAEKPEDYGDYYAWGETAPKSDYSRGTYKWCNGASNKLTKNCSAADMDIFQLLVFISWQKRIIFALYETSQLSQSIRSRCIRSRNHRKCINVVLQ